MCQCILLRVGKPAPRITEQTLAHGPGIEVAHTGDDAIHMPTQAALRRSSGEPSSSNGQVRSVFAGVSRRVRVVITPDDTAATEEVDRFLGTNNAMHRSTQHKHAQRSVCDTRPFTLIINHMT